MRHLSAVIFFIKKPGVHKRPSMLGNGFEIRLERICDPQNRDPVIFLHCKQDGDPPMIRRSLKIAL